MKIFSTILALFVFCGAFVFAAEAQTQRSKKTTRRSNSASVRPPAGNTSRIIEAEVVSTAEEIENQENGRQKAIDPSPGRRENGKQNNAATENQTNAARTNAALRQEINALREQVKVLTEKKGVEDLEKLSVAEERAENFRRKLEEAMARESDLNAKMQQLEYQSRPEVIQLETATIGSTRPEDVREARRKMLEAEKTRLREQINQAQISRTRLEAAIANADALVEKLRARVEADALAPADSKMVMTKDSERKTTETTEPNEDEDSNPSFSSLMLGVTQLG